MVAVPASSCVWFSCLTTYSLRPFINSTVLSLLWVCLSTMTCTTVTITSVPVVDTINHLYYVIPAVCGGLINSLSGDWILLFIFIFHLLPDAGH